MRLLKRRKRGTARQELLLAVLRPLVIITAWVSIKALSSVVSTAEYSIGGDLAATFSLTTAAWLVLAAPLAGLGLALLVIRTTNSIGGSTK